MKTFTKLLALAFLLIMFSVTANAQVTASSNAEATIIAPIGIEMEVELNFGNLAVSSVGGVVTLEPSAAATRTQVGGVTFPTVIGTVTAAEFTVSGVAESTYEITLPSADLIITNTTGSGGETMVVNNFNTLGAIRSPDKANAPLLVDPDTVLSGPTPLQRLQIVSWRNA